MANKYTADVPLRLGERRVTLRYDWAAMARLQTEAPGWAGKLGLGMELGLLAQIVAIGLQKHHPGTTAEDVMAASPALKQTIEAVDRAAVYAVYGPDGPPPAEEGKANGAHPPSRRATGSPSDSAPPAASASTPSSSGA